MKKEKYREFDTEDFLEDEFFRKWVLRPDPQAVAFWEQFLYSFPEKQREVREAKHLLQSLYGYFESEIDQVSEEKARASFQRVMRKTNQPIRGAVVRRRRWLRWSVAACILFLVAIGSIYFLRKDSSLQVYSTGNGERMTIQLPDSSKVQLNANSSLHFYSEKWNDDQPREVWLQGEGYFDVLKNTIATKFIVHAGEVQVAVLGTQFNVRSRGERAEVVLAEGKIELSVADRIIAMQPGDYVSYSKVQDKIRSKKVKPSDYSAWKDGIAVFNNTLSEVAKELEILYGISFSIENENLRNRRIQLSAPADSLQQVLEILQLMYPKEINIQRKNGGIIIY